MTENKNAYKRLSEIQKNLKAPKNQRNTFGNYNFRSCEDILESVKPLLSDGEVINLTDDIMVLGDGDKARFYVKATAKFICGSEVIESTAFAREPVVKKGMDESQITGATSSYARKYALDGLLCIDDTKDADTMDNAKDDSETHKRLAELKVRCQKQIARLPENLQAGYIKKCNLYVDDEKALTSLGIEVKEIADGLK